MTSRDIVRAHACVDCGAVAGERCRPRAVLVGVHASRLRAAGVEPDVRGDLLSDRRRAWDSNPAAIAARPFSKRR